MGVKRQIFPYVSIIIDAEVSDFLHAARFCTLGAPSPAQSSHTLTTLFTSPLNPLPVLPCLSVRSGLDLYLSARCFPPGSEVIMSAVNIPAVAQVVRAHGLRVVPLDIDIETMAPRLELLPRLVTPRSRLLLLANIYGRGYDLQPYLDTAAQLGLEVVEDWAEGFSGLAYTGHPRADLSLFSFGPIKYYTAFGGCIARVRDPAVLAEMERIHGAYAVQSTRAYLTKVLKYAAVYAAVNRPLMTRSIVRLSEALRINYKETVVGMLRGFPADRLMATLRQRPCAALLAMLAHRLGRCSSAHMAAVNERAEYVTARLPPGVGRVGQRAAVRNHWLFPILVKNPGEAMLSLDAVGVDAYRGATQLNVVEPDPPLDPTTRQPDPQLDPAIPRETLTRPQPLRKEEENIFIPPTFSHSFQDTDLSSAHHSSIAHISDISDVHNSEEGDRASTVCPVCESTIVESPEAALSTVLYSSVSTRSSALLQSADQDSISDSFHRGSSSHRSVSTERTGSPTEICSCDEDTRSTDRSLADQTVPAGRSAHGAGPLCRPGPQRPIYPPGSQGSEVQGPVYPPGPQKVCVVQGSNYPVEARYLIDHVIYLPINKNIPMGTLEKMCDAIVHALSAPGGSGGEGPGAGARGRLLLRSKL